MLLATDSALGEGEPPKWFWSLWEFRACKGPVIKSYTLKQIRIDAAGR